MLYVGKAEDMSSDIVLDEILVGPVPVGVNKFVLQADAPDPALLPTEEIIGVTVVLVTCSYREREFVRVGYYVNNEYEGEYDLEQGPPTGQDIELSKVTRQILADKPRVTKFPIPWGDTDVVVSQNAQVSVSPSSTRGVHAEPQEEDSFQSPSSNMRADAQPQEEDMLPATVSSE